MHLQDDYQGCEETLLIAFDVGTTYSRISYSILNPGEKPEIQRVHCFSGQEVAGTSTAKVPSILYYSQDGRICAVGAEAEGDSIEMKAEEKNWVKVEWFTLHLQSKSRKFEAIAGHLNPLPLGKTVVEVLSDFLKYLKMCAEQYIQDCHPGIGSHVWDKRKIHYILSHPNGWGGPQRTLMRKAAQNAGLIPPRSRNQLSFITEGEARLYRCMEETEAVIGDQGISIVHAGNGTIDISAYACNIKSDKFEEIVEGQCHLGGSTFVTLAFEDYLRNYLKCSEFHADIPAMKQNFDRTTKPSFREPREPHYIRFGSSRDKDSRFGITAGKLRLEGTIIASFFEPSIRRIVDSVLTQCSVANKAISHVFLVGGFAANDYLYDRVKDELQSHGLHVHRPWRVAVADGAILGILAGADRNRVSRYPLGVKVPTRYNKKIAEHRCRRQNCLQLPSGYLAIPDTFNVIIERNIQVSETQEFRTRISHKSTQRAGLLHLEEDIICYRGDLNAIEYQYMDNDPDNYHKLCTVRAYLGDTPIPLRSGPGGSYYEIEFDIVLLTGVGEFKAHIAWIEKGEEKRGPARIIYDTNL